MQTSEQLEAFRALCKANGLGKEEVWQHKQSGNWIISRPGIEKNQGLNNITVGLELCAAAVDFAVVKATATRTVKEEGAKVAKKLTVESLGSANGKNCQVSYYAEMAEKRAKGRVVLMLMGFYKMGVFGEDEADDFKRRADSAALEVAAAPRPAEAPKNAPAAGTPAAPPSAAPAPSTGSGLSDEQEIELLASLAQRMGAATSTIELKELWAEAGQAKLQPLLALEKERAKARIDAEVGAKVTSPAGAPEGVLPPPDGRPALDAEGQPIAYATDAQRQEITRLFNHPAIPRVRKTNILLNINKLTAAGADATIRKLGEEIDAAEGLNEAGGLRKSLVRLGVEFAAQLGTPEVERLRLVAEDANIDANELRAELAAAREAINDAQPQSAAA